MKQEENLSEVLDALRQMQSTLKEIDERSKQTAVRVSRLEGRLSVSDSAVSESVVPATDGGGAVGVCESPDTGQVIPSQNGSVSTTVPVISQTSNESPGANTIGSGPVISSQVASTPNTPPPVASPAHTDTSNNQVTSPAKPEGSLESRIGMYWLNRLGIVILVIGFGYLLSHAYEMIGPVGKLAVGFAASLALVVGGEVVARRPRLSWYGQGLVGGGWALAYFAVYAMQNIAAVKVIDDPMGASIGLLAVAAASMMHAVFRRSEAVGMLASLLAFGTISLSTVTTFSVAATAISVVGLAATIVRMRWYGVQVATAIATYATYVLFTQPRLQALDNQAGFWLSFAFLAIFWGVFNFVSLMLARAAIRQQQGVLAGVKRYATLDVLVMNACAFVILTMMGMETVFTEFRYLVLIGAGLAYGVLALAARRITWHDGSTLSSLIGLGLLTASVPLKLDGHATVVVWLLQVPLLMLIGTRVQARSFRWFACGLAVLTAAQVWMNELAITATVGSGLIPVSYGLVIGAAAVIAFFAANLAVRYARSPLSKQEGDIAGQLFGGLAAAFMLLTTVWHAPHSVIPAGFAVEALVVAAIAARRSSLQAHCIAAVFSVAAMVSLVVLYQVVGLPLAVAVTLFLYGLGIVYGRGFPGVPVWLRVDSCHAYFLATTASVYLSTIFRCDGVHTYLPMAFEMFVIVWAGFFLRDIVVRLAGLAAVVPVAVFLVLQINSWSWAVVLPVVACAAALYAAYRLKEVSNGNSDGGRLGRELSLWAKDEGSFALGVLGGGASLLLTGIFWQLLSWQTLAGAWALEGLALVTLGFFVRDKLLRLIGLGVFALMAAKLLFYDLSGADTVERIVSFIVAGLVLLVASFAYSKFEGLMNGADRKSKRQ